MECNARFAVASSSAGGSVAAHFEPCPTNSDTVLVVVRLTGTAAGTHKDLLKTTLQEAVTNIAAAHQWDWVKVQFQGF